MVTPTMLPTSDFCEEGLRALARQVVAHIDPAQLRELIERKVFLGLPVRPTWLTNDQARQHCSISERQLDRLVSSGQLKVRRIGRRRLFNRAELDRVIEGIS